MILQPYNSSTIDALGDVAMIGSPTTNQILAFVSPKWTNKFPNEVNIVDFSTVQTLTGMKTFQGAPGAAVLTISNNVAAGAFRFVAPATGTAADVRIEAPTAAAKFGQFWQTTAVLVGGSVSQFNDVEIDSWRLEFASSSSIRLNAIGRGATTTVPVGRINVNGAVGQWLASSQPTITFSGGQTSSNGVSTVYATVNESTGVVTLEVDTTGTQPDGGGLSAADTAGAFTAYKYKPGDLTRRFVGSCKITAGVVSANSVVSARNRELKSLVNDLRLCAGFAQSNTNSNFNTNGSPKSSVPLFDIPQRINVLGDSINGTVTPVIMTTAAAHGLVTGMVVFLRSWTVGAYNGTWNITVTSPTTFELGGTTGIGNSSAGDWSLSCRTLWLVPHKGTRIMTRFATQTWAQAWVETEIPSTGVSLTTGGLFAATNTLHDIFYSPESGGGTLEAIAWASDTARATQLQYLDGILFKAELNPFKMYIGTIRTGSLIAGISGGLTFTDTASRRFIWNNYNRVPQKFRKAYASSGSWSWAPAAATTRQANADTGNRLQAICGIKAQSVTMTGQMTTSGSAGTTERYCFFAYDTGGSGLITTDGYFNTAVGTGYATHLFSITHQPEIGLNTYEMWESSGITGTTTFYSFTGGGGGGESSSGVHGTWEC